MRTTPLPSRLFVKNRAKLTRNLPGDFLAVVCSNPVIHRNGDQPFPYRQQSDFFYLTGILQEGSTLVMTPAAEILFIKQPDPDKLLWSGPFLTQDKAAEYSGIEEVRWAGELDKTLEKEVRGRNAIYLNHDPAKQDQVVQSIDLKLWDKIAEINPVTVRNPLGPILTGLRMVKEEEEIREIRKACEITGEALVRSLDLLRPGVMEYEIEAELTAHLLRKGCRGHAFEPIVASGENALILHYTENGDRCRKGDLLLTDFGAERNQYCADCTRTVPVSGRFTERQREIYDAAYRVFLGARAMMLPGILMKDLHQRVGKLWEDEHIGLGLYTREEAKSRPQEDPLWKQYFMHGTSHSLGLDVHDPFDRKAVFKPGMVLTCEPAIYIREEGIGIRLENVILITEEGPIDLTADIPMKASDLEFIMQS